MPAARSITSLFSLLVIVFIGSLSPAHGYIKVSGVMTPNQDVFVMVGDSFELNCTVTGTYIFPNGSSTSITDLSSLQDNVEGHTLTAHNISIKQGMAGLPAHLFTYFEDELTVQMRKDNVTFQDTGTYVCFYDNSTSLNFVTLKTVHVGKPPGKPSVACLSNSFLDMVCYITLNETKGNIPYKWEMQFKTDSFKQPVNCAHLEQVRPEVLSCALPTRKENFHMYEVYKVTVVGTPVNPIYGGSITTSIDVMTNFSIVKPGPVRELHSENITSTEAALTWVIPEHLPIRRNDDHDMLLEYEVLVTTQNGWYNRKMVGSYQEQLKLDDLMCNSRYSVAVKSKPISAVGDIYWSVWQNITFHTPQDVPIQSTELSWGSFYLNIDTEENERSVVIYWKNPALQFQCGSINGYTMTLTQISSGLVAMETSDTSTIRYKAATMRSDHGADVVETLSEYRWYFPLSVNMSENNEYLVKMFTQNNNGTSQVSSELMFPKWSEAKSALVDWVSVEMADGCPLVSWVMDSQKCSQVTEVMYYWCTPDHDRNMSNAYALCKDGFDWHTASIENGCSNGTEGHWINTTTDMSVMRFAVAVKLDNNITGGMVWDKFYFKTHDAVPTSPQYQVSPVQDEHTKVKVTLLYNTFYNLEEGGRPNRLEVTYAQSEDTEQCPTDPVISRTFTVDLNNPVFVLAGLKPDASYVVCGRFSNQHGTGRFGKPQLVVTSGPVQKHKDEAIWMVPVAVTVSVVVVIGILCVFFFVKRTKRRISQSAKVEVPSLGMDAFSNYQYSKGQELTSKEAKVEKFDSDSGRGTASSQSSGNSTQQENHEDGDGDHERTPILSRHQGEAGVYELDSNGSVLSGYMDVSEYRSANMKEDLLSMLDEESGETNASFTYDGADSQTDDVQPEVDSSVMSQLAVSNAGKEEFSHYDEIDDFAIEMDDTHQQSVAGPALVSGYEQKEAISMDGGKVEKPEPRTLVDALGAPVEAADCGTSAPQSAAPTEAHIIAPTEPHKAAPTEPHIAAPTEPQIAVPTEASTAYIHSVGMDPGCSTLCQDHTRQQANNTHPLAVPYTITTSPRETPPNPASPTTQQDADKKSLVLSDNLTDCNNDSTDARITTSDDAVMIINATTTPQDNLVPYDISPSNDKTDHIQSKTVVTDLGNDTKPSDISIGACLTEKSNSQQNDLVSENMGDITDLPKHADVQLDPNDGIVVAVGEDTDLFSFDDMNSEFDYYQNPDLLSLGQGSIISDGSEDVRSIRSFTSDGRDRPVTETVCDNSDRDVVNLCNKISAEFVLDEEKVDKGEKHDNKVGIIEIPDKTKLSTNEALRDGLENSSSIIAVDETAKKSSNEGCTGEINSYVRAWNQALHT